MKIKTYQILEKIDKDPKLMVGKRFRQVGGLESEEFGIGDIAIVTEYHGITSLGAEKFSSIRLNINGFEEWEEVKEPVDFMTAFKAFREGKTICVLDDELTSGKFVYFPKGPNENPQSFSEEDIANGEWYIE